ncbi:MAG: MG2 domain-containing protein [Bacteroidota bacterium]|nr:MG2 domain-containing protein [Bacteroidota bacterium]
MLLSKIKYMAIGVAITTGVVLIYNNRDIFKNLTGSHKNAGIVNKINPEFASYISAFTTGYISTGSTIKIKLSSEFVNNTQLNAPLKEKYFSFEPSIEGEAVWKDGQTMEFKPKERLKPGQIYKATFHLSKLVEVKKELEDFEFQFQSIKQSAQLQVNDLKSYHSNDFSFYSLAGNLSTADYADAAILEKTLDAKLDNKSLNIKWIHNDKGTLHKFVIDSIERSPNSESKLNLSCDAKDLNITYTAKQSFEIPKQNDLVLLNTRVVTADADPYVLVNFSNPIDQNQSLEGLITIKNLTETKYIVNNNQVLIYPSKVKSGSYVMKVESVKDTKGKYLKEASEHNIVFTEVKPAVKFSGTGNILPSSNNLSMPFETVNLRAVDVKIIKIYENNVLQFLQTNDLDGNNQIAQVGKKIIEKRINLGITNPGDYGVWKKFSLDLGSLIKSEPGAIYKVYLSFKKSYSTFPCIGNNGDNNSDSYRNEMEEIKAPEDEDNTSYFGYYYDEYSYNYDYDYEYEGNSDNGDGDEYSWKHRDNPCKAAYYRQYGRNVSKSILASDLGLTVKKGNDGSFFAVVNDIVTTTPMSGVEIEMYDYQKQLIISSKTNSDGQAFISPGQKPYFIIAKKDKQRAYLKLDDGSTLSLSMYDVSGNAIKKGVKGFIYGERGVWRPGDSLFLNFILEDKQGSIPTSHPVQFELTNPQGQLYKRILSNKSVDGFYNFSCVTDKNAPTGLWNVDVKIGSMHFSKSVRIETIMPNRLKIEVNVGDNKLLVGTKNNIINLHTNWLTGATARGLAANINVSLSSSRTEFKKYPDHNFNDQTIRFDAQQITVFDGKVDENGNASIPLKLDLGKNAPGLLKANFNTMVFEQGGAFSVDRFSVDYSPYAFYTGIKMPTGEKNSGILYTDKEHLIDIATVDPLGNPVSRANLKFELYKLEWRWWWDQYNDELANYASDDYHRSIQQENFSTSNGSGKVKVKIKQNEWGRYLIRVIDLEGGHSSSQIVYFDWSNWMDRDGGSDNKIVSSMLSFSTDKAKYKTGEEATITIPSPQGGRALVSIENGSRVLEAHWLETEKGNTVFKFKITPQMAPNVYVHVSLMQPHARTNDLPIRLYGVVPISIDDPETHLRPTIAMPKTIVPEQNVTITIGEENSKEMAFTLAVVDEGLLDITRYKTPNPHNTFYAKEALGVKTWDVYDNVIGAFGAELERILSIGGDGSEVGDDGAKANRFKPMVKFFGPYHLNKGEKRNITFKMPMYVGSVRTMLIAGSKGAYGMAEQTTPVKAPLMVLGTLPRVLSVTEEVKLPISVFGGDNAIGNTTVKVEVNGLLQTVGKNSKLIKVGKNDEQLVVFDIKVKNQTGIAKAKITATGGGHTAVYEIELDVRNPNPYQTNITDFWVDGGKTIKETFNPLGLAGTNSGVLELSTIPPINLEERLKYLITYPHGCVEQTTSQTFAQLYLTDIMELSADSKSSIEANIKHGINELRKFQLNSGGLSYWQGMNQPDEWGTTYAGHFMISAEKKGFELPIGFKSAWVKYQTNLAQNFEVNKNKYYNNDEQQAYRLFVLALANQPVLSAMNRLREYATLSNQARWLLAGAYAQIGQTDEAEKLISKATTDVSPYRVNYYTYGSSDRDMAIILDVLCLINKKQQAFTQLKKVADILSSKSWLSTQTTAYGLVAVSSFIKKFGGSSAMQAQITVNGKAVSLKGKSVIAQIPIDFKGNAAGNFNIINNGKGMLYVRLINRGKPPIGEEVAANENISTSVSYKDMAGNIINPEELVQGTNFMLTVNVKNLGMVGEIKNIAIINYIPSGWEIHNARMDDNEAVLKNSSYTYQDIKDDKVLTYFDLNTNESKTFNLMLNASYEGKYYLPALNIEAMYDNSIFARTKGQWIKVVKQKSDGVAGK